MSLITEPASRSGTMRSEALARHASPHAAAEGRRMYGPVPRRNPSRTSTLPDWLEGSTSREEVEDTLVRMLSAMTPHHDWDTHMPSRPVVRQFAEDRRALNTPRSPRPAAQMEPQLALVPRPCCFCRRFHPAAECRDALVMSAEDRWEKYHTRKRHMGQLLCPICLKAEHDPSRCRAPRCGAWDSQMTARCAGSHHALLHVDASSRRRL
jgi:hypothetical protein